MAKRVTTPKKKAAKKPANPRNNPFNLLDAFWDKPIYKTYNNYERGKFYFILQRRFAINFPEMALMLSLPGINAGQVIKFWQVFITQQIPHKVGWSHWLKIQQQHRRKNINLQKIWFMNIANLMIALLKI